MEELASDILRVGLKEATVRRFRGDLHPEIHGLKISKLMQRAMMRAELKDAKTIETSESHAPS